MGHLEVMTSSWAKVQERGGKEVALLVPSCQHCKENLQPDKPVLWDLKLKKMI